MALPLGLGNHAALVARSIKPRHQSWGRWLRVGVAFLKRGLSWVVPNSRRAPVALQAAQQRPATFGLSQQTSVGLLGIERCERAQHIARHAVCILWGHQASLPLQLAPSS